MLQYKAKHLKVMLEKVVQNSEVLKHLTDLAFSVIAECPYSWHKMTTALALFLQTA